MSQSDVEFLGVSDARANLTEVIAKVRLLGTSFALTRRDKPQAMLISMDRWKAAALDAEVRPFHDQVVDRLKNLLGDEEFADMLERKDPNLFEVLNSGAL